MKHVRYTLMLTLIILLFTGCPEFFTFNLYEHLDPVFLPDKEKLDKMASDEAIEYLEGEIYSDGFVDALVEDDKNTPEGEASALDEIDNKLESIYTDSGESTETRTDAAVLTADLRLESSGASDVINNMLGAADQLQTLGSETGTDEEDLKNVLTAIVPPEIGEDEAAFKTMLEGFFTAADTYETLGDTGGILDTGTNAGDAVTGGVVLNAALTVIIDEVASGFVINEADKADVIWDLYSGKTPDPTKVNNSFSMASDPFSDPTITNIAEAAGITDITTLF